MSDDPIPYGQHYHTLFLCHLPLSGWPFWDLSWFNSPMWWPL
ncbi:hypothetical protein MANES_13G094602v8 [Manihot esculenta]|uniref:Uncharacterized protein n=1 Tax=Manihot esculenta TaxID=3983 RepID=A0ACB7GL12_MANES|nr:hypothetical protein MANES_13G094602v8 [Manihot esculenta]